MNQQNSQPETSAVPSSHALVESTGIQPAICTKQKVDNYCGSCHKFFVAALPGLFLACCIDKIDDEYEKAVLSLAYTGGDA